MTPPDPSPLLEARRPLFIHAHPDDETITTGGTLATLVARGAEVTVLTLTRGERGEVVAGPLHHLEGTEQLGAYREGELAAAMRALGISDQRFLGFPGRVFRDSGMRWGPDGYAVADPSASADSLCLAPFDEVLDAARLVVAEVRPDALVSYDERGGYGHPDHVRAHEVAVRLAEEWAVPLYLIVPADAVRADVGAVDVDPVAWSRKVAALRCHATQVTVDGDDLVHSGGQRQAIDRVEWFRRVL
ncbi:PIG-L family deacetylase [Klugiella xanthotipulae]|uniref:N-acetyl-1-D-myo-inositol-2-amino-2-deoxy-alpha-D-glucopyranoside deacetylase n=1 Tax=Klugiella xanthotipulae TaxID=244735 RepID=A0A543I6Y0_9MICO|nr:PIG-L family deacetylase [Klugiella xanthotipulae]TQM66299.1 N-acetyl-1-D-myo-inositol-2-amino-2-deoxy-alpha-D-glucopyranoside deacetylase [Klugiella xanthotipulae]